MRFATCYSISDKITKSYFVNEQLHRKFRQNPL